MGGNLWYTENGEVSTLLFVGRFPRGEPRWVSLSRLLVFRVVYAHIWLVFRVGLGEESLEKHLKFGCGWVRVFVR